MFDTFMRIIELLNGITVIDKTNDSEDEIENDNSFLNGTKVENFVLRTIVEEYEGKSGKRVLRGTPEELGLVDLFKRMKESDTIFLPRTKKDIENDPIIIVNKPFGKNNHPDFLFVVGNLGVFLESKSSQSSYSFNSHKNMLTKFVLLFFNTQGIVRDKKTKKIIKSNEMSNVILGNSIIKHQALHAVENSEKGKNIFKKIGDLVDEYNALVLESQKDHGDVTKLEGGGQYTLSANYRGIDLKKAFEPEYRKVLDTYLLFFLLELCTGSKDYDENSYDVFRKATYIYDFYYGDE